MRPAAVAVVSAAGDIDDNDVLKTEADRDAMKATMLRVAINLTNESLLGPREASVLNTMISRENPVLVAAFKVRTQPSFRLHLLLKLKVLIPCFVVQAECPTRPWTFVDYAFARVFETARKGARLNFFFAYSGKQVTHNAVGGGGWCKVRLVFCNPLLRGSLVQTGPFLRDWSRLQRNFEVWPIITYVLMLVLMT